MGVRGRLVLVLVLVLGSGLDPDRGRGRARAREGRGRDWIGRRPTFTHLNLASPTLTHINRPSHLLHRYPPRRRKNRILVSTGHTGGPGSSLPARDPQAGTPAPALSALRRRRGTERWGQGPGSPLDTSRELPARAGARARPLSESRFEGEVEVEDEGEVEVRAGGGKPTLTDIRQFFTNVNRRSPATNRCAPTSQRPGEARMSVCFSAMAPSLLSLMVSSLGRSGSVPLRTPWALRGRAGGRAAEESRAAVR